MSCITPVRSVLGAVSTTSMCVEEHSSTRTGSLPLHTASRSKNRLSHAHTLLNALKVTINKFWKESPQVSPHCLFLSGGKQKMLVAGGLLWGSTS